MARRSVLLAISLLLTIFVAACGFDNGSTPTTTTATNSNATMATPTTMADNGTMNGTPTTMAGNATPTAMANQQMNTTPTAMAGNNGMMGVTPTAMAGNQNAIIHIAQVMINGKQVNVLTTAKGMILYYKLDDPRPNSNCTGTCAKDWPPLLVQDNMMTITSSMQLPKKLSVYMTANGNQIEYDGHPLYTYAGDMGPGQFTGRGMDNVWYLVGINL